MARTAVQRSITFDPSSRLTDFLGVGYSTTGVAVAPLTSLSPIYPSRTILQLSLLKRKVSARTQRAGDPDVAVDELACMVVMFKKIKNKNVPPGLTVETLSSFFTDLFTYQTSEEKQSFKTKTAALLVNPNYHVLAITVPVFDVQDPSKLLTHFIVGAALFMFDNKRGSFISCLGVVDKGSPGVCMLNGSYFVEPSTSNLLSDTASFRNLGIGTFLLSCLQVLGSLAYTSPIVARSDPFQLACHERGQGQLATHHLYLQARLEMSSPYVSYVKIGFTNVPYESGRFRCTNFRKDCPIHADKQSKAIEDGYHTDDQFMRLLVLKKWVANVYPTDERRSTTVLPATDVWNALGLPTHQYLSCALVPPLTSPAIQNCTNAAYLQLLKCSSNLSSQPYKFPVQSEDLVVVPYPVDRTLPTQSRQSTSTQMISGIQIPPRDIRRCLFPSLSVQVGANKLDAFNAMASSLYSEVNVGIHDDNSPTVPEMALHLRLNLAAFYQRCASFPFTSDTMVEWSILVVEEYEYLVKTKTVAQRGLLEFHVLPSFVKDRLQWKDNFTLLAERLTDAPGGPNSPLWFDMYALQMLFSQHEHPVFISPVYGCLITKEQHDFRAYPHVPSFKSVQWFPGLRDLDTGKSPVSFTVVPILALDTATFAPISYTGGKETHLGLCKNLIEFDPASWVNVKLLRGQPSLVVTGGATEVPPAWLEDYCASKALCVHHGADTPTTASDPQCPGCGLAVHADCGYYRRNTGNKWEAVTCFMCFKQNGEALPAITDHTQSKQKADKSKADKSKVKQKPDRSSLKESAKTKADASKADKHSKPKAKESEADKDDPRRVGPSDFTRGQRPSGFLFC